VALARRTWPRPRWILPVAGAACLAALLAIPSLTTLQTFFSAATNGQGATGAGAVQFGQLLRKLPVSQLSGVWLAGEYRLPVPAGLKGSLTALASAAVFAALIPGVLLALRRREVGSLLIAGVVALVMLLAFPRASPYGQGKLLAILAPGVVFVALAFLAGLRRRLSAPGLALAGALALAILASDGFAYGHDQVAPTARIEAIQQTGDHFAGQGPVLWNEFEEYAKFFARAARISVPFEAITPQQVKLRSPTYFYGHYFDLDEELLSFVEGYPIIVTRRSPTASRPPANYRLVYQNKYYLGWRREAAPQVLQHLPEQQIYSPYGPVSCPALARILVGARPGMRLIVASAPQLAVFNPTSDPHRSGGWTPDPTQAGAVLTSTAGQAEGVLELPAAARYSVWVQGDFPRKVYVQVDGRTVGWVAGANSTGQWLQAAALRLRAGAHRVRIYADGGHRHFGPGEWPLGPIGTTGTIGAVALQAQAPERMRTVPLAAWRTLCGTQADWVELVRP
jgi:hypothetical protein